MINKEKKKRTGMNRGSIFTINRESPFKKISLIIDNQKTDIMN